MKQFSKRWLLMVLTVGTLLLTLTGCGNTWGQGSVLWTMAIFFFWMMYIWIFITVFADIFRRNDISGGKKAMWIILLIFLPLHRAPGVHDRPAEDDRTGQADDRGSPGAAEAGSRLLGSRRDRQGSGAQGQRCHHARRSSRN